MSPLMPFLRKEWLLLIRDLHGLLLLFVMPTVFILIMTFALQNQYSNKTQIDYYLVNLDGGQYSQKLENSLARSGSFRQLHSDKSSIELQGLIGQDKAQFLVVIDANLEERLGQESVVYLYVAPSTTANVVELVEAQLRQQIIRLYIEKSTGDVFDFDEALQQLDTDQFVIIRSLYGTQQTKPSSVQQNVPAWLLFSMFFIAVPLSTTLIQERQQGTLNRLKTMGTSPLWMLFGKMIPYFGINLLQVVAMLLIGVLVVPALGGDRLALGSSVSGLLLIAISTSLAAVCYSLFVAQLSSTVEQATIFSGVCNIIMAAIGGIMVPRFIMPPVMQELSQVSPMAWALDGFFDILLRNGDITDVLPEAGALSLFALLMFTLATLIALRNPRAKN